MSVCDGNYFGFDLYLYLFLSLFFVIFREFGFLSLSYMCCVFKYFLLLFNELRLLFGCFVLLLCEF